VDRKAYNGVHHDLGGHIDRRRRGQARKNVGHASGAIGRAEEGEWGVQGRFGEMAQHHLTLGDELSAATDEIAVAYVAERLDPGVGDVVDRDEVQGRHRPLLSRRRGREKVDASVIFRVSLVKIWRIPHGRWFG
jgi:hypothetical protein